MGSRTLDALLILIIHNKYLSKGVVVRNKIDKYKRFLQKLLGMDMNVTSRNSNSKC